jgi:UTP--glucose-1-phosphate uridylyltransferase
VSKAFKIGGVLMYKKIRKAVIPAAGLGTRFLPATKAQPKEMLPIVDKPTIQYIIEEAKASGIEEILIVTGRSKRSIEDHFDRSIELELNLKEHHKDDLLEVIKKISEINIHYIRQKEPLGLGHAILCAKHFIGDEPFAVLLGDDIVDAEKPCLEQLIDVYNETGASILGVQKVAKDKVSSYGIIAPKGDIGDRTCVVGDMVEKPEIKDSPSQLAVLGRYIITPQIFDLLEKTKPGKGGEIQLTDALKNLAKKQIVLAYDFIGRRYDVGSKQGFLEATVEYALKRPELKDKFLDYLKEIVNKH